MPHPYQEYESTELWNLVEDSIRNLADNKDVELMTNIEYVVGYLCKRLTKAKFCNFEPTEMG